MEVIFVMLLLLQNALFSSERFKPLKSAAAAATAAVATGRAVKD